MSAHHSIASGSTAPLGLAAPARGERFHEEAPDTPALGSRKRSRSSPREASGELHRDPSREQEYQVGEDGELLQRPVATADHHTTWIPEEDKQLSELLATNKPWDEIAKAFPWRTKVSVMNRLYKMEANEKDGAKSPRKRRVPPGVKRSDHHKWDEEGLATLKALATDRKTSWAEIGQRCGGLTGKTVEGKWRRMSLKERSDDSAAGAAPSTMFKAKPRRSKPGPLCLAEREAALEPEHEPAEGEDDGTSTPFRSPAFVSKKTSLDSIERNQAGWALPARSPDEMDK